MSSYQSTSYQTKKQGVSHNSATTDYGYNKNQSYTTSNNEENTKKRGRDEYIYEANKKAKTDQIYPVRQTDLIKEINLGKVSIQIKFSHQTQQPYLLFCSNSKNSKVCMFINDWECLKELFDIVLLLKNNLPGTRESQININRYLWLVLAQFGDEYYVGIHTKNAVGEIVKYKSLNLVWENLVTLVNNTGDIEDQLNRIREGVENQ